ncbi:PREDICTED: laccase-17 [Prunus dulcis]|uniref:PREDICTED: laccase-17 n=1 Tax=Prunus dulcis TaxID=3755 RepID=A0A5E4EUX6_PRUDU|nr:PREDICTED: laccase-17 [Prunus dulcis]
MEGLIQHYGLFVVMLMILAGALPSGEWWNGDVDEVENEMVKYGGGPNISDAYTINGLPGPFYPCSNNAGFLRYKNIVTENIKHPQKMPSTFEPNKYNLPKMEDTKFVTKFSDNLRSLASPQYPCTVPKTIDKRVVAVVSLNLQDCPANRTCKGYEDNRFFASMNNQSFVRPSLSILESHYNKLRNNEYSTDFPEKPLKPFDYTGVDPDLKAKQPRKKDSPPVPSPGWS